MPTPPPSLAPLSPRHAELTELIATGLTKAEIASHLRAHIGVIEVHIATVLRMLDLHTRAEIVEWVTKRRPRTV